MMSGGVPQISDDPCPLQDWHLSGLIVASGNSFFVRSILALNSESVSSHESKITVTSETPRSPNMRTCQGAWGSVETHSVHVASLQNHACKRSASCLSLIHVICF